MKLTFLNLGFCRFFLRIYKTIGQEMRSLASPKLASSPFDFFGCSPDRCSVFVQTVLIQIRKKERKKAAKKFLTVQINPYILFSLLPVPPGRSPDGWKQMLPTDCHCSHLPHLPPVRHLLISLFLHPNGYHQHRRIQPEPHFSFHAPAKTRCSGSGMLPAPCPD